MTYGLDVWYTPPHKEPGSTKNSGSVKALRELSKPVWASRRSVGEVLSALLIAIDAIL